MDMAWSSRRRSTWMLRDNKLSALIARHLTCFLFLIRIESLVFSLFCWRLATCSGRRQMVILKSIDQSAISSSLEVGTLKSSWTEDDYFHVH